MKDREHIAKPYTMMIKKKIENQQNKISIYETLRSEIEDAIRILKSNEAMGVDEIPVLKEIGDEAIR